MSTTNDTRRTLKLGLAALLGGFTALLAADAYAQPCSSDADCADGFACVKGVSVPGCATPPDCPDPTPVEDETGWCEQLPQTCETDADCPAYLKCVANQSQTCWADSEGNTGCDPIDPNAPKTCEYVAIACTTDTDCPANFECIEIPVPCAAVECPPGTECPPDNCGGATEKTCTPKQISCATDADCPTDWLCANVGGDCPTEPVADGGAADPSQPGPAPERDLQPQDLPPDCNANPVMMCVPPGFASGYDAQASSETGAPLADRAGSAADPASSDDAAGCSVSTSSTTGSWLAAFSLAAVAGIVSRRQRRR